MDSMYPLCTFIKSDETRCGSPALKGMNLCFQHIGGNISALTRARATSGANARLKFAWSGDREAIQHNLSLVAQALGEGKIDNATANTYNRLFRTCELNLRRWEAARDSDAETRMLPPPDETPEPAEQQSLSDQDLPPAPATESLEKTPALSGSLLLSAVEENQGNAAAPQRIKNLRPFATLNHAESIIGGQRSRESITCTSNQKAKPL